MRKLESAAEIVANSDGQIKTAFFCVLGTVREPVEHPRVAVVWLFNVKKIFGDMFDNRSDAQAYLDSQIDALPIDAKVYYHESYI